MATRKKRTRTATRTEAALESKYDVVKMGRKIWLAGLGALARSRTKGPKLFESLVAEGSTVHERTREKTERALKSALDEVRGAIDAGVKEARHTASDAWENMEEIFQSRVHKALEQLGVPSAQEIRGLTRKVDDLNRSVQELADAKRSPRRGKHASKRRASGGTSAANRNPNSPT